MGRKKGMTIDMTRGKQNKDMISKKFNMALRLLNDITREVEDNYKHDHVFFFSMRTANTAVKNAQMIVSNQLADGTIRPLTPKKVKEKEKENERRKKNLDPLLS